MDENAKRVLETIALKGWLSGDPVMLSEICVTTGLDTRACSVAIVALSPYLSATAERVNDDAGRYVDMRCTFAARIGKDGEKTFHTGPCIASIIGGQLMVIPPTDEILNDAGRVRKETSYVHTPLGDAGDLWRDYLERAFLTGKPPGRDIATPGPDAPCGMCGSDVHPNLVAAQIADDGRNATIRLCAACVRRYGNGGTLTDHRNKARGALLNALYEARAYLENVVITGVNQNQISQYIAASEAMIEALDGYEIRFHFERQGGRDDG